MHLLYLDESGSVADPHQQYFVLAGVSVFERKTHWIEQELNKIAARFDPASPHSIELHGNPMRTGSHGWKRFDRTARQIAITDCLTKGVASNVADGVRVFAAVIDKHKASGTDPVELAFEQLSNRFDLMLKRFYAKNGNPQRGIILLDKNSTEARIQTMARDFKYSGHTWGKSVNYAEVPVFIDSKASRLIQLADLVSHSIFRCFEHADCANYKIFEKCFDSEGPTVHGLYVKN